VDLQERIQLARARVNDEIGKDSQRLWRDHEWASFFTDADREVARRLYVLDDSDSIAHFTISGSSGSIDSVVVSTVTITSGPISFTSDLSTTAALVAANINALVALPGNPAYRATSIDNHVIVKANSNTGFPAGGYIASVNSTTLTTKVYNLVGLCRFVISPGQIYLPMHSKIINIHRFKPASLVNPIPARSKADLDYSVPAWQNQTPSFLEAYIPNYEQRSIMLYPAPIAADVIEADVYRLPLYDFRETNPTESGEIPEEYHTATVDYAIGQAFLKNDAETLNLDRSNRYLLSFETRMDFWKTELFRRAPASLVNRLPMGCQ
jgi:hypothetical protein